jgi:hypothetical protein
MADPEDLVASHYGVGISYRLAKGVKGRWARTHLLLRGSRQARSTMAFLAIEAICSPRWGSTSALTAALISRMTRASHCETRVAQAIARLT